MNDTYLGSELPLSQEEEIFIKLLEQAELDLKDRKWKINSVFVSLDNMTETVLLGQFYWLISAREKILFKDEWIKLFIHQLDYYK